MAEGRQQERVVFVTETRKPGRTAHTLQESGFEETRVDSMVEGSEIWGSGCREITGYLSLIRS